MCRLRTAFALFSISCFISCSCVVVPLSLLLCYLGALWWLSFGVNWYFVLLGDGCVVTSGGVLVLIYDLVCWFDDCGWRFCYGLGVCLALFGLINSVDFGSSFVVLF